MILIYLIIFSGCPLANRPDITLCFVVCVVLFCNFKWLPDPQTRDIFAWAYRFPPFKFGWSSVNLGEGVDLWQPYGVP